VLHAGGFTTGGTHFDARIRRQSLDPEDRVLSHVGAIDICARGLKAAALLEDGGLEGMRAERYAGWNSEAAQAMLTSEPVDTIAARVEDTKLNPQPRSGRQERLENWVSRFV
jgi:xylose isomerase